MFGTDLRSTRARRRFENADLDLLLDAVGDETLAQKVLFRNALVWYRVAGGGLPPAPSAPPHRS